MCISHNHHLSVAGVLERISLYSCRLDVYASWLIVAIVIAFLIMIININGAKTAAVLQTVLTCIIGGAGIILIVASVVTGSVDNLQGQMFVGNGTGEAMKSII